ncbi:Nramp family divalent metal transporter [Nitratiruptor tergarcus]|uniref:NRAMP (Natural resistance-associated macrophage protein) metal ion transporters n=1 Tax=Nitratiruptor tergarcus DSM 16512 TaxID=1069081 RepID=A0A1W1WT29_9BACT|nr:Nramp family divalent metal transporter [Nitratiruptor tergarcus]SMC09396.1 NRAMP (natural resistance-associated macrophage protein) metal ion transporters [Nitratiruptor tergarcus DSM 16512]
MLNTTAPAKLSLKERIRKDIEKNRERIKELGPGFITGGAGDDPAGIVTYTLVGATTGFSQLWLLLLSTPMMISIQNMVARIAIVTGKSLPEITTAFYSKKLTIFMIMVLAIANILTIGADLNAIAAILHIVTGYPTIYFLIPVTALIAYLITFGRYKTIKHVLVTLTIILVVYIISAIMAKPPLLQILQNTFIPHIEFSSTWILAALGLLGTTISPYLLFWQASEEKEEKKSVVQADEVSFDTLVGMIWSNLLSYAMIITGAVMLYGQSEAIEDIGTLAVALKPAVGDFAFALFAIGVIISGFLAIPVLAGSTAYAVADTFGWREGMDNKVSDAKGFYFVFVGALVIADLIDMIPDISAVDALYYSQVLDGMLIPILIAITLLIANDKRIMGEYLPSRWGNLFAIFALIVTISLVCITFWQWLQ